MTGALVVLHRTTGLTHPTGLLRRDIPNLPDCPDRAAFAGYLEFS
jgi:hypothetical protein